MSTTTLPFRPAERIHRSLTASLERRALQALARRMPDWVTSDQLTALGFAGQLAAAASFALARYWPPALLLVVVCLTINWFGDSLDGTLARMRGKQRPRFGFYVDHITDLFGATAMMSGLAFSGLLHASTAAAMLIAFLLLSAECFLATYTLGQFHLSAGLFGPTEIRLLLAAGALAALHNPKAHLFHHSFLLFDVGGSIAIMCMLGTCLALAWQHTARLYQEEPLA